MSVASELHEMCLAQTMRAWAEKTTGSPAPSLAWPLMRTKLVCALELQPETDSFRTCLDDESLRADLMVSRGDRR